MTAFRNSGFMSSDFLEVGKDMEAMFESNGALILEYNQGDVSPANIASIQAAIEESETMLDLSENWDDEGAKKIDPSVLKFAHEFTLDVARWALYKFGFAVPAPRFGPVPDGGVNIYWKNSAYSLLINISPESCPIANFYGEIEGRPVEGNLDLKDCESYLLFEFFKLNVRD